MEDMKELFPYKECEQYINLLQENITRMANNSANCKNWLIAILAGICALGWNQISGYTFLLLLIPIALFCFLDCLYLGMERVYINKENTFIDNCKECKDSSAEEKEKSYDFKKALYDLSPSGEIGPLNNQWKKMGKQFINACKAFVSLSTGPFYLALIAVVITIAVITHQPSCQCSCCCM